MAVSNQEVAAWLAANPTATDAQIAQAALAAGVSSQQLAQVTGIPVEQVESRITAVLPSLNPTVEQRWQDLGEAMVPQYFVTGTNIQVDEPTYTELAAQSDSAGPRVSNPITIYDAEKKGTHTYSPEGEYMGFSYSPRDSGSLFGFVKEVVKGTAPIWTAALAANAGSLFGNAGAGAAAATDASFLAADAAQLAAQGLSESAIAQVLSAPGYASSAAANLAASMAANGLDAATMTQQLNALGTNTGLMSQTGSLADIAATGTGAVPATAAGTVTGALTNAAPAATTAGATTAANAATTGLTNAQVANLVKGGLGLVAGGTVASAVDGALGGGRANVPQQTPTQGMPTYSPEYYNQLQQYYNAYLPQTPRDVVSPLQQWYNS